MLELNVRGATRLLSCLNPLVESWNKFNPQAKARIENQLSDTKARFFVLIIYLFIYFQKGGNLCSRIIVARSSSIICKVHSI